MNKRDQNWSKAEPNTRHNIDVMLIHLKLGLQIIRMMKFLPNRLESLRALNVLQSYVKNTAFVICWC